MQTGGLELPNISQYLTLAVWKQNIPAFIESGLSELLLTAPIATRQYLTKS